LADGKEGQKHPHLCPLPLQGEEIENNDTSTRRGKKKEGAEQLMAHGKWLMVDLNTLTLILSLNRERK